VVVAIALAMGSGIAVADVPCPRFAAGGAVGYVSFPFSDDDTFSAPLVWGYAGGRPRCGLALTLRVGHTADTVDDPFDPALDQDERYVMLLPSLRLGSRLWLEIGVGGAYAWRHYHNGTTDDGVQLSFDAAVGATLSPRSWVVKPELSLGFLYRTGIFLSVGAGY
jgi:hypothetical protein